MGSMKVLLPVGAFALALAGSHHFASPAHAKPRAAKSKFDKLQKRLKKQNAKFRIAKTSAWGRDLHELAGSRAPADIRQRAKEQNKRARKALAGSSVAQATDSLAAASASGAQCDPGATAFNWRDAGMMSPVRNQRSCGSCWAFGALAAYEGSARIFANASVDLSEQHMITCGRDDQHRDAGSCALGGWFSAAFDQLVERGGADESAAPYRAHGGRCDRSIETPYHAVTWGYVSDKGTVPPEADIKQALCRYGPLATSIYVNSSFQAYAGGVFDDDTVGENANNHIITLVGWDDDKQAYLIRNSWGKGWGEKGYAWVEYGTNNVGKNAAWIVPDAS
jgi:cathepsin L